MSFAKSSTTLCLHSQNAAKPPSQTPLVYCDLTLKF